MNENFFPYIDIYLKETAEIITQIDRDQIALACNIFRDFQPTKGRLFILGVGGSAGVASHAVNDFRKIAQIEAYAPTDNVSELTAWVNDDSWEVTYEAWLKESRLSRADMLLVFSVGGGSSTTSQNLVRAMQYAKKLGCRIVSVVSRDGGVAAQISDACILIPVISNERITPHAEGWQGIVWHLIVNSLVQVEDVNQEN